MRLARLGPPGGAPGAAGRGGMGASARSKEAAEGCRAAAASLPGWLPSEVLGSAGAAAGGAAVATVAEVGASAGGAACPASPATAADAAASGTLLSTSLVAADAAIEGPAPEPAASLVGPAELGLSADPADPAAPAAAAAPAARFFAAAGRPGSPRPLPRPKPAGFDGPPPWLVAATCDLAVLASPSRGVGAAAGVGGRGVCGVGLARSLAQQLARGLHKQTGTSNNCNA
jgi:hypothetical protein